MADLMQQASELILCPFCGGEAERIDFGPGAGENEGGSCIACRRCQASGPVEFGFKENFVANWNRRAALRAAPEARPLDEWHEDMGAVTWWRFPVEEAAWIGTPLDSDWPGYHTHWTPHPAIPVMLAARPQGVK